LIKEEKKYNRRDLYKNKPEKQLRYQITVIEKYIFNHKRLGLGKN
jgi:hypothetical protein